MSFDYKQLPRSRPDLSGNFVIGLFFGFLLGLGVAAGIAIYFFKTPIPFADRPRAPDKAPLVDQKLPEPPKSAKAIGSGSVWGQKRSTLLTRLQTKVSGD